jgi:single-strand DNA-binding protein
MSFEIEGILHKKYEIESKSSSFQTREFVITTEGTYPQYVKFQLTQDKCGVIDSCNEGEKVKVYFDLRGREWQGKYFTNLNAWKVEKISGTNAEIQSAATMPNMPPVFEENQDMSSGLPADFDDLPF